MDCEIDFFIKNIPMKIYDYANSSENTEERDLISKFLYEDKCWKPYQTEITKEILSDGGTFIDIGCHIGYYSILASILKCKVISVDLNMNYITMFMKTIRANDLEPIEIKNIRIAKNTRKNNIIISNEKIKLIKISIQGNESYIIDCFNLDLKSHNIENIIMEITPKYSYHYIKTILKLYKYGYKIYDIGNSKQRTLNKNTTHLQDLEELDESDLDNLEEYLNNIEHGQTNFLFRI